MQIPKCNKIISTLLQSVNETEKTSSRLWTADSAVKRKKPIKQAVKCQHFFVNKEENHAERLCLAFPQHQHRCSLAHWFTTPSALTHTYGHAWLYTGQMRSRCSPDVDKEQEKKKGKHQLRRPTFPPQLCGAEADGGKGPCWIDQCCPAAEFERSASFQHIYLLGFI